MVKIVAEALGDLRITWFSLVVPSLSCMQTILFQKKCDQRKMLTWSWILQREDSLADFEKMLSGRGFFHDFSEGAPMCRWQCNGITVDLMATESGILGFGNQWYQPGFAPKKNGKNFTGRW